MRGRFITFEGGEGCGKSTQIRLLYDFLKQKLENVVLTKEPGGTEIGLQLRQILVEGEINKFDEKAEALLFFADRRIHLTQKVWPALEQGAWVLSDRYADSTMAYQYYAYDKRLHKEDIEMLYQFAAGDFKPDLTLILDLDPKIGLQRSFQKANGMAHQETRNENRDLKWHENLRRGFLEIAQAEPTRCVVLNANQSVEDLHQEVVRTVCERFGLSWKI